jgi:SAM-dependent methyltransferase
LALSARATFRFVEELFLAERAMFPDRVDDRADATYTRVAERRKNVDFLRMKDAALNLVQPSAGVAVVEFGCSVGAELVYCGLQGAEVHGVDLDPEAVALANKKLAHLGIEGEALVADATAVPYPSNQFEAALSSDFHEHLDEAAQLAVLREALRVLKPGGRLVLKTPNLSYLRLSLQYKRFAALARGRDPRGYVIPHSPGTNDPQHIGLTTRWVVERQLAAAGFQNWRWHHPPLRRFGQRHVVDVLSSEVPVVRDVLCEDLLVVAWKPIALSHFPD